MRMDKEKFLKSGLLEQYVLGLTDEEESREVERYAEAFPEIKAEIDGLRRAMDEYARHYASMPPEELKERVMQDVGGAVLSGRPGSRIGTWLARAVMALLIILCLSFYQSKVAADRQYQALDREYRAFQLECSRRQSESEKLLEIYAFLNHTQTQPVRLMSTGLAPDAEAIAYLNKEEGKVFVNPTHLPAPPPGKTYQIWADVKGEMISMGLIDGNSKEMQPANFIEGTESLNITLEPEGGSEEPTVAMLYVNSKV